MPQCKRCASEVDESAYACQSCGYEPRNRGHLTAAKLIGALLCMTIVGAVVGLPLMILAEWLKQKRKDDRPYEVSPPGTD